MLPHLYLLLGRHFAETVIPPAPAGKIAWESPKRRTLAAPSRQILESPKRPKYETEEIR